MKIQRISQDIYLTIQSPHIKTGSVRNLSNQCYIDNNVVDAIGVLKVAS
jgi:hypothetical protein